MEKIKDRHVISNKTTTGWKFVTIPSSYFHTLNLEGIYEGMKPTID